MHGQIPIARQPVEEPDTIDLHRVLDFVWRRWRLIAWVAAAVLLLALVIVQSLTPRFTSAAEILLDLRGQKAGVLETLMPDAVTDGAAIDSQLSILRSSALLQRVVEQQRLVGDAEFGMNSAAARRPWYRPLLELFSFQPASETSAAPADIMAEDVRAAIAALRDALIVGRVERSYVLRIEVTSIDPAKAARLANAIADAFVVDQLEARFDAARRASNWLTDRLDVLRAGLRRSEEAVEAFRANNNLVATATGTINEQQLSEINATLVAARAAAAEKQAKYEQAQRILAEGGNIQAAPDVVRSNVVANLRTQQAEVTRREADLVTRYGERHPLVVNVRAERREIDRQIGAEVGRIIANLKNDYDVAQSRVASLAQSVALASGQAGADNALAVQLRELERDAFANRVLYESFLQQSKLIAEQSTFETREARIITPAAPPETPSSPRKRLILGVAGAFGLLLGGGLAVLLEALNPGFSSPRQVEEVTGLPVLASVEDVPSVDPSGEGGATSGLIAYLLAKPLSRFSESIRSLRAGIQMSDVDRPPQVVQFTSATPGEGKTSLAMAVAISAAAPGRNVVLLDCDLRRPEATRLFGLDRLPGLVDLLTQTAPQEECLHRDKATGLFVMGAGSPSQSPPDLLGSRRMQQLLDGLRQQYDLVVIDTPPVGPVIDAPLLAQLVDKIVFVVRWGATSRELVQHAIGQISGDRKICGIALNRIDLRSAPRYGRYGYYSSHYYKKYYAE